MTWSNASDMWFRCFCLFSPRARDVSERRWNIGDFPQKRSYNGSNGRNPRNRVHPCGETKQRGSKRWQTKDDKDEMVACPWTKADLQYFQAAVLPKTKADLQYFRDSRQISNTFRRLLRAKTKADLQYFRDSRRPILSRFQADLQYFQAAPKRYISRRSGICDFKGRSPILSRSPLPVLPQRQISNTSS